MSCKPVNRFLFIVFLVLPPEYLSLVQTMTQSNA